MLSFMLEVRISSVTGSDGKDNSQGERTLSRAGLDSVGGVILSWTAAGRDEPGGNSYGQQSVPNSRRRWAELE